VALNNEYVANIAGVKKSNLSDFYLLKILKNAKRIKKR